MNIGMHFPVPSVPTTVVPGCAPAMGVSASRRCLCPSPSPSAPAASAPGGSDWAGWDGGGEGVWDGGGEGAWDGEGRGHGTGGEGARTGDGKGRRRMTGGGTGRRADRCLSGSHWNVAGPPRSLTRNGQPSGARRPEARIGPVRGGRAACVRGRGAGFGLWKGYWSPVTALFNIWLGGQSQGF